MMLKMKIIEKIRKQKGSDEGAINMLTYHRNQRETKIKRLEKEISKMKREIEEIDAEIKRLEGGK